MSVDLPRHRSEAYLERLSERSLDAYTVKIVEYNHWHFSVLRQKLAESYLASGYLTEDQLEQGALPDHYQDQSVVFDVQHRDTLPDEPFLAGARLLLSVPGRGLDSLQIHLLGRPNIVPEELAVLLEQHLERPGSIAEFATHLMDESASPMALIALYRSMALYSHEQGISTWVMGLKPEVVAEYEKYTGPAMRRIGEVAELGQLKGPFIPCVIDVKRLLPLLLPHFRMGRVATKSLDRTREAS